MADLTTWYVLACSSAHLHTMAQAFIITLREGLEAALILGIVLAYLARTGQRRGFRAALSGAAAAALLSLAAGAALFSFGLALEGTPEQVFEGAAMLLAVVVLTWMIVWMKRHGRHVRGHLESELRRAAAIGPSAVAGIAFLAVGREGLETALFLFAAHQTSSPVHTLAGRLLGLALAAAIGLAIYRGSSRLNLNTFFTGTGLLLILIAAGLTAHAVHELQEARLLPVLIEHVWDTNALLHENSTAGSFLKGLFGYNGNPSLIEVTAYFSYLAVALAYFVRSPRPRPARGAPHPATLGQTD